MGVFSQGIGRTHGSECARIKYQGEGGVSLNQVSRFLGTLTIQ